MTSQAQEGAQANLPTVASTGDQPLTVREAARSRRHRPFTNRQEQILRLIADDLSDHQVASALGLSPHTVRAHLDRIFCQHGIHTRAGAVALWLRVTWTDGQLNRIT